MDLVVAALFAVVSTAVICGGLLWRLYPCPWCRPTGLRAFPYERLECSICGGWGVSLRYGGRR